MAAFIDTLQFEIVRDGLTHEESRDIEDLLIKEI